MAAGELDTKSEEDGLLPSPKGHSPAPSIKSLRKYFFGPRDVSTFAQVGIFLILLISFFYFAKPFLMPVVLAVLLNFLLKPMVRLLAQFHIPEGIGAAVVLILFLGAIGTGISGIAQPAAEWAAEAPESLRVIQRKVHHLLRPAEQLSRAAEHMGEMTTGADAAHTPDVEIKAFNLTDAMFSYTRSFLAGLLETVVLLYFLLASGDLFMQKLVKVMPTLHDKKHAVEIAHEVQHNISTFLFTITIINVCLGVFVALGMLLIGMPNPVFWGVVAGFLNFIPYFGPFVGVAILALVGLLEFDTGRALIPPLVYLGLHGLESNFITPMVLGRRLTLNPVVIFMSLIFWTWLWGIPGALLAVPMLMTLKILCDHFRPLVPISQFLSGRTGWPWTGTVEPEDLSHHTVREAE